MKRYLSLALSLFILNLTFAQVAPPKSEDKWSLQKCVDYALANNISVKQADVQARFSALALKESRASQLPSLNLSSSAGESFGLSNNPTTGILENNSFFNFGAQLQSQVTIFNWFSKKNTIASDKLTYQADLEQTKKIQNDIALNVAVAYLQILLAREQINVSKIQVGQTYSQLTNTRKQVDAGKLPELNAAQLESQLAADSSSLITAQTNAEQFVLQLKALLNVDAGAAFDIETPAIDRIPIETLGELQPEAVYASALANLPQQKVNQLRIDAARYSVKAAKAGLYPTLTGFGSLSSNYVNLKSPVFILGPKVQTGATVNIGGVDYGVEAPTTVVTGETGTPFGKQFKNNFGQSIGIGLNIPILNGRAARTGWERSKLTVQNLQLTKDLGDQQLKQDIYKAYIDATAAIQKFSANKKGAEISQKAYDFAQKRYDQGLLSTFELLNTQYTLLTAKTQLLYAQYDYVFKMKLLEFYKGQGLKL